MDVLGPFLVLAVLAVPVIILIRLWILSQRVADLKEQVAMVSRNQVRPSELAELRRRVYRLEGAAAEMKTGHSAQAHEASAPVPQPAAAPKPEPELQPAPEPKPAPVPAPPPPLPVEVTPQSPRPSLEPERPPLPAPVPLPSFLAPPFVAQPEPVRPSRSSEEWEAVVGGNWLNKLGVFVLVIAIALFLDFSFAKMGPTGRSAVGLAISLALLLGGVLLERRARYVVFGRGLIGGGWAGLYFTTYAMQAVDAAKVIHNPLLGGILLLGVAAGMVLHSLRYRVPALTVLAYFMAFAALAITNVTALSVIALIPLAGSLLIVAYRFSWSGMALFGL